MSTTTLNTDVEIGEEGKPLQKQKDSAATVDTGLPSWPDPPAPEAYYGLAGEIVREIEPESESDVVALLVQLLVAFGSVIGRTAHFSVEGDTHHLNLYAVLVGETSKARKGTSWGRIKKLLNEAEQEWAAKRILGGLSSGEGLIWAVRDPIMARRPITQKGRVVSVQEYEQDKGELDKRLLIIEPEYANVLKQVERTGNVLSATLRQAWESGNLRTLTTGRTHSPVGATGGHISLIGHVTCEELRRYLSSTECANGFGNRNLWLCVRRSKFLPEGGCPVNLARFTRQLGEAITHARSVGQMRRDDAAREVWREVYPCLSEAKPGLAGCLIARGEAQVCRLACLYALLDLSAVVRPEHLAAALALWEYCERSVRYVFGDSLGDPLADEILRALKGSPSGLTRTAISDLCGHHESRNRIGRALALLLQAKLARVEQEESGGRPVERWFAGSKKQ